MKTDASSWKETGLPYFCELIKKSSSLFTLKIKPNIGPERTDYFFVKTGNQQVKVNVKQKAGSGVNINRIWTEHNVAENDQRGMKIHVEFESSGLMGHTLKPCVFFYKANQSPLSGVQGSNYITSDGQATVQKETTSRYNNSTWRDFTLFMPYQAIDTPRGKVDLLYRIDIYDCTDNTWTVQSGYESFSITKN